MLARGAGLHILNLFQLHFQTVRHTQCNKRFFSVVLQAAYAEHIGIQAGVVLVTELQLCPMQVCSVLCACMSLLQRAVLYMYTVQSTTYLLYARTYT